MEKHYFSAAMVVVLIVAAESGVSAQHKQGDRILDVQLFHPEVAPGDFLNIPGAVLPAHGELVLGAYFTYLRVPLETRVEDSDEVIVRDQGSWELSGALSLWERLLVGLAIPVSLLQSCPVPDAAETCEQLAPIELGSENFEGGGFGDLRLLVRGVIMRPGTNRGLGLAAGATISFPTADATAFVGEGNIEDATTPDSGSAFSPTGSLLVSASYRWAGFRLGANVGYLIRRRTQFLTLTVDDQLLYGVAAGKRFTKHIEAIAEFNGRITPSAAEARNSPHEALFAARYTRGAFRVDAGTGVGVVGDYGAPDVRLFVGVAFSGKPGSADHDQDGIPDGDDACPQEAEDRDGHEDQDGCPELDNDKDGIPDALDQCPNAMAVTATGCPAGDTDKDGLADDVDQCPRQAEDKDGFNDDDGCPEADNDADNIPDNRDRCPNDAETFNNYQDEDGCPDTVPQAVKPPTVTATRISIDQKIEFERGRAALVPTSNRILDAVAKTIIDNKQLRLIRIEGHTDNTGNASRNKLLSQQRAETIRRYLISRGVSARRLQAVGYGSSRPIASNDTEDGRARNRRVEFIVVQRRR